MIRLLSMRSTGLALGVVLAAACLALLFVGPHPRWMTAKRPAARAALTSVERARVVPPPLPAAPVTAEVMPVSRTEAQAINARMAFSTAPVEPARPFVVRADSAYRDAAAGVDSLSSRDRAAECLTAAVYYEAASESEQGQRAVAQVVLNRVRHPAFPKSVCEVVYQGMERATGCQFTFTCDGSLMRTPSVAGWARARRIALAALAGAVEPSVGTATHYHTDWVVPYWAPSLDKVTMVGAHIFYRWKGYWGRRAAFNGVYVGEAAAPVAMAAMRDDGVEGGAVEAPPRAPAVRLLADMVASPFAPAAGGERMAAGQARKPAAPAGPRLRADENRGTLAADEHPVALAGQGGTLAP